MYKGEEKEGKFVYHPKRDPKLQDQRFEPDKLRIFGKYANEKYAIYCCRFSEFPLYCILLKYSVVPAVIILNCRHVSTNLIDFT
jgi:hypothetical protein